MTNQNLGTDQNLDFDVLVIGGGVAGLSAALMLGRARRRTLVVDSGLPRNRFADHMHGVLGHEGTAPADLLQRGRVEAAGYGVDFTEGLVTDLREVEGGIAAVFENGTTVSARAVIVATGFRDELPHVPGLAEYWGKAVLHCPYCHGWEVRDQRLAVFATSELSLHQAALVRQWSNDITLFAHAIAPLSADSVQPFQARGIQIVNSEVVRVEGDGSSLTAVHTADGAVHAIDALFTHPTPVLNDRFLANLNLDQNETPFGTFPSVDFAGKTSNERIWAVGNISNPGANVAMAMGAGAMAGGAVNGMLVEEDFDHATHHNEGADMSLEDPTTFWEDKYAGSDRVWSGNPNRVLRDTAANLTPGRALDLGCGEGADVVWLAQQGWQATGVDISETATSRAREAASGAGIADGEAIFVATDLSAWIDSHDGAYELVTASFFQSPVALARTKVLTKACSLVVPGGHILITSHGERPPWASPGHGPSHFLTAQEEFDALALSPQQWETVTVEMRAREATSPAGEPCELVDSVVLLKRL